MKPLQARGSSQSFFTPPAFTTPKVCSEDPEDPKPQAVISMNRTAGNPKAAICPRLGSALEAEQSAEVQTQPIRLAAGYGEVRPEPLQLSSTWQLLLRL